MHLLLHLMLPVFSVLSLMALGLTRWPHVHTKILALVVLVDLTDLGLLWVNRQSPTQSRDWTTAGFYPIFLALLFLDKGFGHCMFLILIMTMAWFGLRFHNLPKVKVNARSWLRVLGQAIIGFAGIAVIMLGSEDYAIRLAVYVGGVTILLAMRESGAVFGYSESIRRISLAIAPAVCQPHGVAFAAVVVTYALHQTALRRLSGRLLRGSRWGLWILTLATSFGIVAFTQNLNGLLADLTCQIWMIVVLQATVATPIRSRITFSEALTGGLLLMVSSSVALLGNGNNRDFVAALALHGLDYSSIIAPILIIYLIARRILPRSSEPATELVLPSLVVLLTAIGVQLAAPQCLELPISQPILVNRDSAPTELTVDSRSEYDTIQLITSAQNAYGLLPRQQVLAITVFFTGGVSRSYPLLAGYHTGEAGREMPLILGEIAHPSPPVAYWRWVATNNAEILYRSLYFKYEIVLDDSYQIDRLRFEYSLDPGLAVDLTIYEVNLYKHNRRLNVGPIIKNLLTSIQKATEPLADRVRKIS